MFTEHPQFGIAPTQRVKNFINEEVILFKEKHRLQVKQIIEKHLK
jgi:hypothetical protein